jgi:ribosome-binding factor A
MSHHRIPRTNELLKEEIGKILLKEVVFEGALLTITRVETSSDLSNAHIFVSVIPETMIDKVFRFLNNEVYYIQKILNKKLRMRPIPKIRFVKEIMTSGAQNIEGILEGIKENDNN